MVNPLLRTVTIPNETAQLETVRVFVRETLAAAAVGNGLVNRLSLAIDEAVSNIIVHGYETDRRDTIEVRVHVSPGRFEVTIRDSGKSFQPKDGREIDLEAHVQAGRRSGLGIFLMRQVMDEVEYSFREGLQNELRMVKYL